MKHLKLFEEFTRTVEPNQNRRSEEGSPNWFTREEIESIREGSESKGIGKVSSKYQDENTSYFGTPAGRGLAESVEGFFARGEDLCNSVCLKAESGDVTISKKGGVFTYTSESGSGTSRSLDEILKNI
jgi:hypothetical protein